MAFYDLTERIKFRNEIGRELKNAEVDDNFRYLLNPWSINRVYTVGMTVINEKDVSGNGTQFALYLYRANTTTSKGVFIETEWDLVGDVSASQVQQGLTDGFTRIIVNSSSTGTFTTTANQSIIAVGADTLEIEKGNAIKLEQDITNSIIRISVVLNPTLTGTTLALGNESVNLSSLISGMWTRTGTTLYNTNYSTDNVVIGGTTASAKLDVIGTLRIGTAATSATSNSVLVFNTSNVVNSRIINAGVWNTSASFLTGTGTVNYIPFWSSTGSFGNSIMYQNTAGTRIGFNTINPQELADFGGAIKIGTASNDTVGSLRWSGSDFEGRMNSGWVSLTTASIDNNLIYPIVGSMFSDNIDNGLTSTYNTVTQNIDTGMNPLTVTLIGKVIASGSVTWGTNSTLTLNTLFSGSIALGTDTSGIFLKAAVPGNGISIINDGVTTGETVTISANTDASTITFDGTGALQVAKLKYGLTLTAGNGITLGNATVFDGSATLSKSISIKNDIFGGANIATSLSVTANGIGILIDNVTIVENASNQLTLGVIQNTNLQYNSITLNSHTVSLGGTLNLVIKDISDVLISGTTPLNGDVLKYNTTLSKWVSSAEGTFNKTGSLGDVKLTDSTGNLQTTSNFNYDTTTNVLAVKAYTKLNEIRQSNNNILSLDDFYNEIRSMTLLTVNEGYNTMHTDGNTGELYVPDNAVTSFKIRITAIKTGGTNTAALVGTVWVHEFMGAVKQIGGVLSIAGTQITEETIVEETGSSTWNGRVSVDNINKSIKVEVSGDANVNVKWGAMMQLTTIKI
jgi:hypothetical protein